MSDSTQHSSPIARIVTLILVAGAALVAYLVLLRQWPESQSDAPAFMLPLVGFGVALCAGIAVGLWWPTRRPAMDDDAVQNTDAEVMSTEAVESVHTDETPTVSALTEEEHIPGAVQSPPAPPPPAAPAPAQTSVAIDDRPRDEAMAAKDEVIRSLENIVKENRDRWADFEQDRDALETKVKNLEAELRIAQQIIENGGDEHDVFMSPQVLSRI